MSNEEIADQLEVALHQLTHLIKCLRGEEIDMTGQGTEKIFFQYVEQALGVKIIAGERIP